MNLRPTGSENTQRFDERDIVFARQDLFRFFGRESSQFKKFYLNHPDLLDFDETISKKCALGERNQKDSPIFRAQFSLMDDLGKEEIVAGKVNNRKAELEPHKASEKIKAVARHYGASAAGIGPLNQDWVYSHVGCTGGDREGYLRWGTEINLEKHQFAVAMIFPMDLTLLASAPFFPTLLASANAYSLSALVSINLAEYIRGLGYEARAHHFSNYQVLAVPVAADCGLGELSRAGFLLNKTYGLGFRLSIVTTEMPLNVDPPADFGVQSFCRQCLRCAAECPSGAIPSGEKTVSNGILKWKLDEEKCYAYWHVNGTDCGICMAVCPWTKPQTPFHRVCAEMATFKGPHQKWMARADRLVYGKHKPQKPPDFLD